MKKFSFNLQKALDLRQYREEEAKIELGRAVSALAEIENRIKENAAKRLNAVSERFSGAELMLDWERYIVRLDQEAERLAREAARAELAVEEQRANYMEASKELKVMEKLKEKREKEYRKEMFASETAELDSLPRRRPEASRSGV